MSSEYKEKYVSYLGSAEWKKKREARLAISQYRCAACGSRAYMEVHHLTYSRIFQEEMSDLLPLCKEHHKKAEQLIKDGHLTRKGDPVFLATETIRLILNPPKPIVKEVNIIAQICGYWRNQKAEGKIRINLESDLVFMAALHSCSRFEFRKFLKRSYKNGFILDEARKMYDEVHGLPNHKLPKNHPDKISPKQTQTILSSNPEIMQAIQNMERDEFRRYLRAKFRGDERNRMICNAIILYNRSKTKRLT